VNFKIGVLKSENQVDVYIVDKANNNLDTRVIDVVQIQDENFNALLLKEEFINEQIIQELEEEKKYYPVYMQELFQSEAESLASIESVENLYNKVISRWTLQHNFNSIENIFTINKHMKALWKNDRYSFFEELWFFLKTNLATHSLRIIFNDATEPQGENEKAKLTQSCANGEKTPVIAQGSGAEAELLQHYQDSFKGSFNLIEYNEDKGRFAIAAQVESSPILIMGEVSRLTTIQRAMMASLFNGFES
jgi:hypothetical protein